MMTEALLDTRPLFPVLDQLLLEVLRSLSPADWQRPTLAGRWQVRDVAAHLLDGNLRALSLLRDGHFADAGPASPAYTDMVHYLNELNESWVVAARWLSPAVLIDLLAHSGPPYYEYLASLDPLAPATFAVAWAGEAESPNWFHVARDYTEKWHHQQQIRQAVGQEAPLFAPALYQPYLATSVRALPHRLRTLATAPGTVVRYEVTGPGGGSWAVRREAIGWMLLPAAAAGPEPPQAHLRIPGPLAWQLLSGYHGPAATAGVELLGDQALGQWVLGAVAVMK